MGYGLSEVSLIISMPIVSTSIYVGPGFTDALMKDNDSIGTKETVYMHMHSVSA